MIKLFRPKRAALSAEPEEPVVTSPSAPESPTPADAPPLPVIVRRPNAPKVYIARPEFGPDPGSAPPSMRQAYLSRVPLRPDAKRSAGDSEDAATR
jgi:hypothetical protein